MKCSLCHDEAEFICFCSDLNLCFKDLAPHILEPGGHKCEALNISLDQHELELYNTKIIEKVEYYKQLKSKIYKETQILFKQLENIENTFIQSIDTKLRFLVISIGKNKISLSERTEIKELIDVKSVIPKYFGFEFNRDIEVFYSNQIQLMIDFKPFKDKSLHRASESEIIRRKIEIKSFIPPNQEIRLASTRNLFKYNK